MRRERPHPDYYPGDICMTTTCGNKANPETLFCELCVPIEPGIIVKIIRLPFVLLAMMHGV